VITAVAARVGYHCRAGHVELREVVGIEPQCWIASDRHYMSDVLTGAAVGSAIGDIVPRLHRHVTGPALTLNPTVTAADRSLLASLIW
jgi:hypothetical protein